jgi:flagellar export protein FliJ
LAREKARELMAVAEEKHEILIEASQAFRILEKLKEKKREEFKIQYNKKQAKEQDDITIMRMAHRGAK